MLLELDTTIYPLGKVSSAILLFKETNESNCSQSNKLVLLQECILGFSNPWRAVEVEAIVERKNLFFERYWGKFGNICKIAVGFNCVQIKASESRWLFLLSVGIVTKSLVSKWRAQTFELHVILKFFRGTALIYFSLVTLSVGNWKRRICSSYFGL